MQDTGRVSCTESPHIQWNRVGQYTQKRGTIELLVTSSWKPPSDIYLELAIFIIP
ncbi:hypothetical protein SAMN05216277_1231, partial [Halolamina pelagica]